MFLYLVRHGDAVPENVSPERPLSEKGMLDVSEIAAFMNLAGIKADEIWHSEKLRAKQTANILAEAIPHKNLVEREGLAPNDSADKIIEEISTLHEDVIIVGHIPSLERIASRLLTKTEDMHVVNFKAGGVICLEKWEAGWAIAWMIAPDILSSCVKP